MTARDLVDAIVGGLAAAVADLGLSPGRHRVDADRCKGFPDGDRLVVNVAPADLDEWERWTALLGLDEASGTHRGEYTSVTGRFAGVRVLLLGHGVPGLHVAWNRAHLAAQDGAS